MIRLQRNYPPLHWFWHPQRQQYLFHTIGGATVPIFFITTRYVFGTYACDHTLHRSLVRGQRIVDYAGSGPRLPSLVLLFFLPVLELGKLENAVGAGEVGQVQLVLPGELRWDESTAEEMMPALEVAGASLRGGERNEEVRLEAVWVAFLHIPA